MEFKDGLLLIGVILLLILIVSVFICFFISMSETMVSATEYDEIRVIGEITEVIPLEETMIIIFNGNETYEVNYPVGLYTDLTVNSELIVTLRKYTFQGIFFKSDNIWTIQKIIKVPGVKE